MIGVNGKELAEVDRHLVAYQLIATSLRRHGLPANTEEVMAVLDKMPLPPITRLAIAIAHLGRDDHVDAAIRERRAESLAGNPFA